GALMGLYDAESEDDFITRGVAQGDAVNALIPDAPRAAPAAANDDPANATTTAHASGRDAPGDPTQTTKPAPDDLSTAEGGLDLFSLLDAPKPDAASAAPTNTPSPSDDTSASPSGTSDTAPAIDVRALLD